MTQYPRESMHIRTQTADRTFKAEDVYLPGHLVRIIFAQEVTIDGVLYMPGRTLRLPGEIAWWLHERGASHLLG